MPRIPLLKFPYVVQCMILPQIDPIPLIKISLESTKLKNVLQAVKLSVDSISYTLPVLCTLEVKTEKSSFRIQLTQNHLETTKTWRLHGNTILVAEDPLNSTYFCQCESEIDILEKLNSHILSILRTPKFKLVINRDFENFRNLFIWKKVQKFECIKVSEGEKRVEMSSQNLNFLLEDVEKNEIYLNVRVPDDPNFKYKLTKKVKKIHLKNPEMIDLRNILTMASHKIICEVRDGPPVPDINTVMLKWMSGENETLEHLEFQCGGILGVAGLAEGTDWQMASWPYRYSNEQALTRVVPSPEYNTIIEFDIRRNGGMMKMSMVISPGRIAFLLWTQNQIDELERRGF